MTTSIDFLLEEANVADAAKAAVGGGGCGGIVTASIQSTP
jgi:hypothetical protein